MIKQYPLRVAIMDDDYFALQKKVSLLARDLRTKVCIHCESAEELLTCLRNPRNGGIPEVIILDAEYRTPTTPLDRLITSVRDATPGAAIICLSQYGDPETVRLALTAGVRAFLLKNEVRMAISTAVVRATQAQFLYTLGIENVLQREFSYLLGIGERLSRWKLHPDLSPHLTDVFWLCIVYGLSSRQAAEELDLATTTVEKYRNTVYDILGDGWLDDSCLSGVDTKLERERVDSGLRARVYGSGVRAFHRATLLPHSSANAGV
jgi:DNA-binding NarL/FixJ family response regulator